MHSLRQISGPRSKCHSVSRTAFTLIEVLVVVAIIALLVSILLPSLKKAREQAKLASCNANLHDFGTSHHQYAHSNDPYFPLPCHAGSNMGYGINSVIIDDNLFVLYQFRYAKDINSWNCPAKSYKLRKPDLVDKVAQNKPQTMGSHPGGGPGPTLPPKSFIRYNITTAGDNTRSDFRVMAQTDNSGYGSSYEYKGWSICSKIESVVTYNNWHYDHYGSGHWGEPKNTRIGKPLPQHAMLMTDADDGGVVGTPPWPAAGSASNDVPEEWDNHGAKKMNILFVDGHAATVRDLPRPSGQTELQLAWKRNDCNQEQAFGIKPW